MRPKGSVLKCLAVACFGLTILLGCNAHGRSMEPAKPTSEAQPLFTPLAATLAQQKMCDEQAAKRFREDENRDDFHENKKNPPISDYTSHYEPSVNVCYVRIHSMYANPAMVSDAVYDAFGGRVYANYVWVSSQGQKYAELSPSECGIYIPGKADETCKTAKEFNDLTEKYFGVTR